MPADGRGEPEALLRNVSAGRPSYSADGASIYFFSDTGGRARLAVMPSKGGQWRFVPNDTVGHWSHGPVCDPDGRHLWYHCGVDGGSLCKLPLAGGEPKVMKPPGFERRACAHASVSRNGIIAFDWVEYVKRSPQ